MTSIVLDLDGTLCDATHRVELARNGEWDAFHEAAIHDKPNRDVQWFLQTLPGDAEIIIVTGRNERYRQQTLIWLYQNAIWFGTLLMRPDDNYQKDPELKIALLEAHFGSKELVLESVLFALDDRDGVVEAFRNYGLPCWQCRQGTY